MELYADPCAAPPAVVVPLDSGGAECGPVARAFVLLDKVLPETASTYYGEAGPCTLRGPVGASVYRRLGPEIDASAFAEVTIEVDQ